MTHKMNKIFDMDLTLQRENPTLLQGMVSGIGKNVKLETLS